MRLLINDSINLFNNDLLTNFSFFNFQTNNLSHVDYTLLVNDLIYLLNGKELLL